MPLVRYGDGTYPLNDDESVLDGLLRHGVALSHSCKAGVCGTCIMRALAGPIPSKAQASLKDSWKLRGYFMACVCIPADDLEIAAPGTDFRFGAVIESIRRLSNDVVEASLVVQGGMEFRAGQYITVVRQDGLARSYSIASLPEESVVQLHIRRIPNGRMSNWFHEEAQKGEPVTVLGPSGECFYIAGREDQPLLLAGAGTGLAPLYGIVRDALLHGHRGPIHLFHGALQREGLYLVEELRMLARQHEQLHYNPAVLRGEVQDDDVAVGALDQIIASRIPDLTGWRGFVCGDPKLVQDLKKKVFLAGMASRDIYADAFIPAGS